MAHSWIRWRCEVKCQLFSLHSWKPCLSPLLALCVFLVCERHRGEASDWFPYIDVLPSTYTCPAYFTDDVMAVLPASVRRRALEQREVVQELHSSNQNFFRFLQPILNKPTEDVLTSEALRYTNIQFSTTLYTIMTNLMFFQWILHKAVSLFFRKGGLGVASTHVLFLCPNHLTTSCLGRIIML